MPEADGTVDKKLLGLHFLSEALSLAFIAVLLFLAAGRIDSWPAWALVAVWLAWFSATDYVLLRSGPDLLSERIRPPKGMKSWDQAILSALRLMQLARYILAGLDWHYGWTRGFPLAAQAAAIPLCLACTALFAWAMASNGFFSQVVRIQADRGHSVATGGPYRYVRHPGYAAMILFELSISALLASWWAIAAAGACAILIIARTALEDRALAAELAGYAAYARRVRYRLLPGVW